jgi:hypothetical protein
LGDLSDQEVHREREGKQSVSSWYQSAGLITMQDGVDVVRQINDLLGDDMLVGIELVSDEFFKEIDLEFADWFCILGELKKNPYLLEVDLGEVDWYCCSD